MEGCNFFNLKLNLVILLHRYTDDNIHFVVEYLRYKI